jgi:hypothetical protein
MWLLTWVSLTFAYVASRTLCSKEDIKALNNKTVFELKSQAQAAIKKRSAGITDSNFLCLEQEDFVCIHAPTDEQMHCVVIWEPENTEDMTPAWSKVVRTIRHARESKLANLSCRYR